MEDSTSCNNNPLDIKCEIISNEEDNETKPKIENNQTDADLNCQIRYETIDEENGNNTDQNDEKMDQDIRMECSNTAVDSENINDSEIKQESQIQLENTVTSDKTQAGSNTTFKYKPGSKRPCTDKHLEEIKKAKTVKSNIIHVEYSLTISNMPSSWSFMDIKNFIDMQCGPVDEMEMIKDDSTQAAIRLIYQNKAECKNVMKKLSEKFEGTKYTVAMMVDEIESDQSATPDPPGVQSPPLKEETTSQNEEKTSQNGKTTSQSEETVIPWKPDLDTWDIDPNGTYGLKESFLKSLSITPPLDRWVHVSNFRCDKHELRDLAEMAGRVLLCSVFTSVSRYANVMYAHPLEAVQAVSMFHGQSFYGQTLRVIMIRGPTNTILLPKGLTGVGKGLGSNGRPLRSVRKHYKRFINKETASLNRKAFDVQSTDDSLIQDEKFQVKTINVLNDAVTVTENKTAKPKESATKNNEKDKDVEVKKTIIKTVSPKPVQKPIVHNNPGPIGNASGQGYGPFGPPRPMWTAGPGPNNRPFGPGPGPRPWNGPGPMGPMQGPRPMVPQGPMGPVQGPMRGPGPMPGTMAGPMPMGGPMPGPMGGHMPRPMQNIGGPIQNIGGPMQNMGGAMPNIGGPMQNMGSPMQGPTVSGQMGGPMQGPGPVRGPMRSQGPMVPYKNPNEPVQLQLSNLPPSTTFAILCDKMASCGQVVSIQLTTPGAAVVTFANKMQADNCFKTYHNYCIEGCVIQVKYT